MMAAVGVARCQDAGPRLKSDFRATAQVVLNIHQDDEGFCLGCYVYFCQLKPFPCEYYSWAARVLASYPKPAPSIGRAPVRDRRPGEPRPIPAPRLVPSGTNSPPTTRWSSTWRGTRTVGISISASTGGSGDPKDAGAELHDGSGRPAEPTRRNTWRSERWS